MSNEDDGLVNEWLKAMQIPHGECDIVFGKDAICGGITRKDVEFARALPRMQSEAAYVLHLLQTGVTSAIYSGESKEEYEFIKSMLPEKYRDKFNYPMQ